MTKLRRCSPEIERELHDLEARIRELEGRINRADRYLALGSPNGAREALAPPDSEPAEGEGGQCPRCGVGGLVTIEGRDWISVHDALPHKGSLVLVTYKGGKRGRSVHVARWTGGKWLLTDRMKKVQDRVTAWMPCPNPFVGPGKSFRTSNEPAEGEGDGGIPETIDLSKRDQRPQRYGWAPGYYANTCQICGKQFVGDKRAWNCAPCAYGDDTTEQQDAMLERRDAQAHKDAVQGDDEAEQAVQWFVDHCDSPHDDERDHYARTLRTHLRIRQSLSRTSDEGTGSVVPEVVRQLPDRWRYVSNHSPNIDLNLAAEDLDRAIAEQGGQRVPDVDEHEAIMSALSGTTMPQSNANGRVLLHRLRKEGYRIVASAPQPEHGESDE